jgi:hypothetical protein
VSCDPGEDADLVSPADGISTFVRLSTALGLLHWIGPDNEADCIVEELLIGGVVEEVWAVEVPQSHQAFVSALEACPVT